MEKNKKIIVIAGVSLFLVLFIFILVLSGKKAEEVVYKETVVGYGELSVGITESSTIEMETITQSFELDISALVKEESENISSEAAGQGQMSQAGIMGPMGQQGQSGQMGGGIQFPTLTGSGLSYSSKSADITAEEVMVSVGQKVQAGDLLIKLTENSVKEIRGQLETDLIEAENDWNSIESSQRSSKLEAEHNYDSSVLYGKFAQIEYDEAIEQSEDQVIELEKSLTAAQEAIAEYEEKLEYIKSQHKEAVLYCTNITETVDQIDQYSEPAWYTALESTRIEVQETVYSLEEDIEQLEKSLEENRKQSEDTTKQLEQAKRNLEQAKLTAKRDYDLRMLASNTAQESYDISIGYLEQEASKQKKAYDSAKKKMDTFDSVISKNGIYAKESGVITEISIDAGDSITTGTELLTMYTGNASLTVSLEENEAKQVTKDSIVKVSLLAYPDQIFEATVNEISDAQYDSSTNTSYYDITVDLKGSQLDFYQEMTGDVTFITKETREITYVSNRAIFRDGIKSYVKMKDENGKIIKREVVTGFSDGVNVEIIEGLSKGEIVLIESKVSDQ